MLTLVFIFIFTVIKADYFFVYFDFTKKTLSDLEKYSTEPFCIGYLLMGVPEKVFKFVSEPQEVLREKSFTKLGSPFISHLRSLPKHSTKVDSHTYDILIMRERFGREKFSLRTLGKYKVQIYDFVTDKPILEVSYHKLRTIDKDYRLECVKSGETKIVQTLKESHYPSFHEKEVLCKLRLLTFKLSEKYPVTDTKGLIKDFKEILLEMSLNPELFLKKLKDSDIEPLCSVSVETIEFVKDKQDYVKFIKEITDFLFELFVWQKHYTELIDLKEFSIHSLETKKFITKIKTVREFDSLIAEIQSEFSIFKKIESDKTSEKFYTEYSLFDTVDDKRLFGKVYEKYKPKFAKFFETLPKFQRSRLECDYESLLKHEFEIEEIFKALETLKTHFHYCFLLF